MLENHGPTFRDLTLNEVWRPIKRFFYVMLVCVFVFVLPHVLLNLGTKTVDTMAGYRTFSKWIGYIFSFWILFYIVIYIHELFSSLAELFANLANLTKAMSKIKRTVLVIMLVFYFLSWIHFPTIAFLVSVLAIIPSGFTYDEYKRLLTDRLSTHVDV